MTEVFQIKIDIKDISDFVNTAQSISNDINLCQGNSVVSGKSVMGVMSLDLSEPIDLIVRDRESDDMIFQNFGRYLVPDFNEMLIRSCLRV